MPSINSRIRGEKMDYRLRYFMIVLASVLLTAAIAGSVLAEVLITEVLYDPATSESDTEFVELYNTGDTAADISGWKLNTTSVQAAIPDGTEIAPGSYYLIADIDGSASWPADWPAPDLADEITLTNTDSGIRLQDAQGNLIDALGWGNPAESLYLGTSASHVPEGESLARKQQSSVFIQTRNNSNDFLAALPTPKSSRASDPLEPRQELTISASVSGNKPSLESFTIIQDDKTDDGIQILPLAGKTRNLTIQAAVSDQDGIEDIASVKISAKGATIPLGEKTSLNTTSSLYEATLSMAFYDAPGIYNLTLAATDSSGETASTTLSFEYLSIVAFGVDTSEITLSGLSGQSADAIGDLDFLTPQNPTIKNLGNTPLDFRLSASDLDSGSAVIPAGNLQYTFLDSDFTGSLSGTLSNSPQLENLDLLPGHQSLREFSLRLSIPLGTGAGSYQGTLYLSGVAS